MESSSQYWQNSVSIEDRSIDVMLASGDAPSGDAGPPGKSMRSSRCPSASWEHFSHRDPTYSESYSSAWLSSSHIFWLFLIISSTKIFISSLWSRTKPVSNRIFCINVPLPDHQDGWLRVLEKSISTTDPSRWSRRSCVGPQPFLTDPQLLNDQNNPLLPLIVKILILVRENKNLLYICKECPNNSAP